MKKDKIGLFGGTFNPIHSGHIKAAEVVQKVFVLDRVLFIPSFIPPHKESEDILSPGLRLKMVELAVGDNPQFIASPIEVEARVKSYSILTLQKINALYPGASVFFILGVDAFLEIDTWKDYEEVMERCFFVVISRKGYNLEDAKKVLNESDTKTMYTLSSNEEVRNNLLDSHTIFLLPFEAVDVASTEIRERSRKKQSIKGLVPGPVADFITKNKLYQ